MRFFPSLVLFSIGSFLILTTGCSNSGTVRDPNTLVYLMYNDVQDWDPASAFSLEVLPLSNIYEPLLWYDASSEEPKFIPALATSYSRSEGGLLWTFNLRKGVRFHDGRICNAHAVKQCIERTISIGEGPAFIWDAVEFIEILDNLTLAFHLKYPAPMDHIVSAQYGAWIYSPGFAEMDRDVIRKGYAAGTGPYKLGGWVRNQTIILEANEDYWDELSKDSYQRVELRIVSEAATRIQMIKGGEADICSLIPIEALRSFENHPDIELKLFPSWVNHMLIFNVKKSPTDDLLVRQAIAATLDYDSIIKNIYSGMASQPTGLVPSSLPGAIPPDKLYEFDLDRARSLLKEAEVDEDEIVKLSYVASSNEYWKTCLMLQANCRKIGLKTELHAGLWSEIWSKARKFESAPNMVEMAWWPTYTTPSDWFLGMFTTQDPPLLNLSYYSNNTIDSLIQSARKMEAIDRDEAARVYGEIQSILVDNCVAIPVADLSLWIVVRKELTGFRKNPAYATILFHHLKKKPS